MGYTRREKCGKRNPLFRFIWVNMIQLIEESKSSNSRFLDQHMIGEHVGLRGMFVLL